MKTYPSKYEQQLLEEFNQYLNALNGLTLMTEYFYYPDKMRERADKVLSTAKALRELTERIESMERTEKEE